MTIYPSSLWDLSICRSGNRLFYISLSSKPSHCVIFHFFLKNSPYDVYINHANADHSMSELFSFWGKWFFIWIFICVLCTCVYLDFFMDVAGNGWWCNSGYGGWGWWRGRWLVWDCGSSLTLAWDCWRRGRLTASDEIRSRVWLFVLQTVELWTIYELALVYCPTSRAWEALGSRAWEALGAGSAPEVLGLPY